MNFVIPVREGVELRLRTAEDANDFFLVVDENRQYLRKWLPWLDQNRTSRDSFNFINRCYAEYQTGEGLSLGIWSNGEWIGSVGFHDLNKAHRRASIGYWLAEKSQGKGIMTQSVRALMDYGFKEFNLNRIEIHCATGNERSCAVPKRLRFVREGTLKQVEWLYDHFVDHAVYSKLRSEWCI